jgi:hypothetical protein
MYQFIETISSADQPQPLFNVGQASFDCYDIPEEDASEDKVEEFLTDAFHHPVLFPGLIFGGECLIESIPEERRERRLQTDGGSSFCSYEVFSGLSAVNPMGDLSPSNGIGAALTMPIGDLDLFFDLPEEHGLEDEDDFFPDLCTHLASYAKHHLDPDACFIGISSQRIRSEDFECVTSCAMEVKPGVLHIWVNEAFNPTWDRARKLQGGLPPAFQSAGVVAHKISNN